MSIKYLVSNADIKKLVKIIKKHSDSSNEEILRDLVSEFGYSDVDDFKNSLKKKKSGFGYKTLDAEDLVALGRLQEDICKAVTSDTNDDFKLTEVPFIQQVIKKKLEVYSKQGGGYNLSTYLMLYPYVADHKDEDGSAAKIITSEFLFNESSLESFIYNILARYRAAKIPKSVFSKLLRVRIASEKDKKHIEKHKLTELRSYLANDRRINSAEEFLLPLIFRGVYDDGYPVESFVESLKNRIKLEHRFYKGFLLDDDGKLKVKIPVFSEVLKGKPKADFVKAKKIIGKKSELLLGISQPKSFLATKSPLALPKEKVLENIYLVGSIGSGVFEAHFSMLMSNIINGSGFLNISSAGDSLNFVKVVEMAKMEGREKDCVYFNWENVSLITPSMVREFVLNNRLVHIEMPCLERSKTELVKSSCVKIFNIIKMFAGVQSMAKYPFTLGLLEGNHLMNEVFRKLRGSLISLNVNNINLLISDSGWVNSSKDRMALLDLMENQIVMFDESDQVALHFGVEKEFIRSLKVGEFIYFYDRKRLSKDTYKFLHYIDTSPEVYINLPRM